MSVIRFMTLDELRDLPADVRRDEYARRLACGEVSVNQVRRNEWSDTETVAGGPVIAVCQCGKPVNTSHAEPGLEHHVPLCCDCFDALFD